MGQARCLVYLFIRGIQLAVSDILHDGSGKQMGILQHDAQRTAQIRFFDLVDIDSVIADFSVLYIIKTVDQVGDRRFSCAGGANECQLLSGLRIQRYVMQNHLIVRIAKGQIEEPHVSLQLRIGNASVRLMRVPPGPQPRSFLTFRDVAVRILLRIHQGYIAVIHFRLLIHQAEDPLCARQGHDDGVKLLCHLHEGLGEALGKLQIRHNGSDGQAADSRKQQNAAQNRGQHELDVADISHHRPHDAGKRMRLGGTLIQPVVEHIEFFLGFALMIKYLNHALAVHLLFHISCHVRQIHLLADEILAAVASKHFGNKVHDNNHQHCQKSQGHAQHQHGDEGNNDGEPAHQNLGNGLINHLTKGVRIIGIQAHDGTVGILVKIADGKRLHVLEHLIPYPFQNALPDFYHQSVVKIGTHDAHCKDASQHRQRLIKPSEIRIRLAHQGKNVIIQKEFHGEGNGNRRHRTQQNADHNDDEFHLIGSGHIFQQPCCCFHRVLGHAVVSFIHPRFLLSPGIHRPRGRSGSS